jgi:thioredoxin 1
MEQVSRELPVQFIDVDASPQLVAEYGVRSVPTVIIINNGQVSSRQAGVLTESQIKSLWSQN